MKGINYVTAYQLKHWQNSTEINGKWTPVRPYGRGGILRRIKMAWLVFTGKADVLTWNKQ